MIPILNQIMDAQFISMTISSPRKKGDIQSIKIRPVIIKGNMIYQETVLKNNQVFHTNYNREQILHRITETIFDFRQMHWVKQDEVGSALISKKGKITSKVKKQQYKGENSFSHNRQKQYLLQEGECIPFLVDLGVMTKEGKIVRAKYDKFKQINRFLEFIEDILVEFPTDKRLHIIDFGCGKSYLTFAMYYYLCEKKGYQVKMTGLDLKKDVIEHCNRLAQKYGYKDLEFLVGDIASYEEEEKIDLVVTLHACDTATDFALAKAVSWDASVILSVPCCQHELNKQIEQDILAPIMDYGLLKERFAALVTDGMRAKLLESKGYQVQILEFIDMEHTPKNILIRAIKRDKMSENKKKKSRQEFEECRQFLKANPTLDTVL